MMLSSSNLIGPEPSGHSSPTANAPLMLQIESDVDRTWRLYTGDRDVSNQDASKKCMSIEEL